MTTALEILGLLVALPLFAAAWSDYCAEREQRRCGPVAVCRALPYKPNRRRGVA